jgi:HTH-type transcriptional regulator / antitoxin HipB
LTLAHQSHIFPFRKIEMMTPTDIGTTIRAARKAQGLRQDELAAAANVGVRFLIELEAGKETAQLGKTLAVLSALGIDVALTLPDEAGA